MLSLVLPTSMPVLALIGTSALVLQSPYLDLSVQLNSTFSPGIKLVSKEPPTNFLDQLYCILPEDEKQIFDCEDKYGQSVKKDKLFMLTIEIVYQLCMVN